MFFVVLRARVDKTPFSVVMDGSVLSDPMVGLANVAIAAGIDEVAVRDGEVGETRLGCEMVDVEDHRVHPHVLVAAISASSVKIPLQVRAI